jgi:transcriptional regulator with XRE-family HTH domain
VPRPRAPLPDWLLAARRDLGDRLRAHRLAAHLSQETLAELAGIDRKTVSRLENGHTAPPTDTLLRIAHALGRPLDQLLVGLDPDGAPPA